MRILFVDDDVDHARDLHSQILSYRGIPWDLVHCEALSDAVGWLERDHFDSALLSVPAHDVESDDFESFVRHHRDVPIVVVSPENCLEDHLRFARAGAGDCLCWEDVDGDYLMRRLRLAAARFHRNQVTIQRATKNWVGDPLAPGVAGQSTGSATNARGQFANARSLLETSRAGDSHRLSTILVGSDVSVSSLARECSEGCDIQVVGVENLNAAREMVRAEPARFDAVLTGQGVVELQGFEGIQKLRAELGIVPLVMLMTDRSDSAAVTCIEHGVEDCLAGDSVSWTEIDWAVRMAWARITHVQAWTEEAAAALPDVSNRRASGGSRGDRRTAARYLITRPIIAIPVLPNGAPEKNSICEAFTIDVGTGGVAIQMASRQVLPSRNWVLGIESVYDDDPTHDWHFVNVVVKNTSYSPGGIRLGMEFQRTEDDLLNPHNLQPQLEQGTHRVLPLLPQQILDDWIEVGVLRPVLLNRIKTCPECSAAALVGDGCRECGAAQIEFRELLHHFACAYVGDAEEFESPEGVSCPKCMGRGLVVGADFEVINARYRCLQCGFEGNELEQVGSCLNCQLRFPIRLAHDEEVFGYDVDRVDILAFLNTTV